MINFKRNFTLSYRMFTSLSSSTTSFSSSCTSISVLYGSGYRRSPFTFCYFKSIINIHSQLSVPATTCPKPQHLFFSGFQLCFVGFCGNTLLHPKAQQPSCGIDIGAGLWEGYLCVDFLNLFLFPCGENSSSSQRHVCFWWDFK